MKIGVVLQYIGEDDCSKVGILIEKECYKLIAFDKSLRHDPGKRKRYAT